MNSNQRTFIDRTPSHRPLAHALVFIIAMSSILMRATPAEAELLWPVEYRVGEAIGKHNDVSQYAVAFHARPPRRLRAERLEVAIGTLANPLENRAFVSVGPVWRLPARWQPFAPDVLSVDVGFSPTWISGSRLTDRDLGGNLHFTSSLSLGAHLNRQRTVHLSLRVQHTSNGGLDSRNPGLDMIGLSLVYRPRQR